MTARCLPKGSVAVVLGSALLSACAGHAPARPRPAEAPALTATLVDLIQSLEMLSARAATFVCEAELRFEDLATGTTREVGLKIAGRKPAQLRLQGHKALLPSLFVLVANEDGVWLDVPSRRKTYLRPAGRTPLDTGGVSKTLLAFDAGEFLSAILPDPPDPGEAWILEELPRTYVITALVCAGDGDGYRPSRRLTFERERLELSELQIYRPDGRVVSITRFGRRGTTSGLPRDVRLERPFDRVALSFAFASERAAELGAAAFRFSPPPGRQLVDVTSAPQEIPDSLPAGEEAR